MIRYDYDIITPPPTAQDDAGTSFIGGIGGSSPPE
jgi:hypothetical protein